ncbi:LtfC-like domain-containing protein [Nocardia sp. CA-119907]|uniref:LtfC-like domain-containing protein n=1 Tax=Nocardia sp. CA-119907 TaxID=3239973 RepID=UPI003D995735
MPDYIGYRPHRYTLILSRGAAFTQRFETSNTLLSEGTTSWIDIYNTDDELLTTWNATTISPNGVEYQIDPDHTEVIGSRARASYNLYLNYPGTRLPYCWFRGPILREH